MEEKKYKNLEKKKKMMECNFFHYLFIYFTPPRKKPTLSRKNPHGFLSSRPERGKMFQIRIYFCSGAFFLIFLFLSCEGVAAAAAAAHRERSSIQ